MFIGKIYVSVVALGGLLAFNAPSLGAPLSTATDPSPRSGLTEHIGWRCGPGLHMNRRGRCVPNREPARCARGWHMNRNGVCVRNRPVPRACARGYHLTPRGYCVRNW